MLMKDSMGMAGAHNHGSRIVDPLKHGHAFHAFMFPLAAWPTAD
jgi:hypothetical protein